MGNQTSQIFALLYLNDLDHYIKEILNIKYYIRYMDDMIILVNNKELARFYLNCIKNYISSEDLIVNPKSSIIDMKCGIEFLGYRYYLEDNGKIIQIIKKGTKKRIILKLKSKKYNYEDIYKSIISCKGFCDKSNSYYFYQRIKNI